MWKAGISASPKILSKYNPAGKEIQEDHRKSSPCALTKHHAMKAYWRNGGIATLIL
jgi:hypothetical protein